MPQSNYLQEAQAETVDLGRLQERVQMGQSGAGQDLKAYVQALVDEAHESIVGCMSNDPTAHMRLVIRYQQRIGVAREIQRWFESAEKEFSEITEAMRQDLDRAAGGLN